ncbi:MAG TPA: M20/M25/M40 family metallo-hydrolase [Thermoanaerobaculia bacterium]|nr:M20/M25/M40 family metallo-hydrolase [Thermoanaerobaculia bacterium]
MSNDLPAPIFDRTFQLLRELTAISSPSGDLPGLRRMTERLSAELSARGFVPEVLEESGEPVLVARGPNTANGHLLLIGHMDTVLPAAEPRIEGDRLVATGAIDMKGGLAAFLGALDLLAERGVNPPDDMLLVVVPDEEVGGPISHGSMKRWGEGARALWVLEPGEPAGDAETMVAGRRGMFDWRMTVKGQAAHSGLHYWEGRSALAAAARWTVEAQALSRRDGGPTINVGRLVAGDASFVENLATAYTLVGTDRQLNVVPDRAVVEGETRFLRPAEESGLEDRMRSLAREIARETGTEMVLTRNPLIPPVDPDGPHAAVCERAVALAASRGWELLVERERGGISFPNFLPDPGRLPVLDGLGPVGGGMHTREEYLELRSLGRRVLLLADLLTESFCNASA